MRFPGRWVPIESPEDVKQILCREGMRFSFNEMSSLDRSIAAMFRRGFLSACSDAAEMGLLYSLAEQVEKLVGVGFKSLVRCMEDEDEAYRFLVVSPERERARTLAQVVGDFAFCAFGGDGLWSECDFVPGWGFWACLGAKLHQMTSEAGYQEASPLERAFWAGVALSIVEPKEAFRRVDSEKFELVAFLKFLAPDIYEPALDALSDVLYGIVQEGLEDAEDPRASWMLAASDMLEVLVRGEDQQFVSAFDLFRASPRGHPLLIA